MVLVNGYYYAPKGRRPRDSGSLGQNAQRQNAQRHTKQKEVESCIYCEMRHPPRSVLPIG